MASQPPRNPEEELPDWLKKLRAEQEDDVFGEQNGISPFEGEKDAPEAGTPAEPEEMSAPSEPFEGADDEEQEPPEWLLNIRRRQEREMARQRGETGEPQGAMGEGEESGEAPLPDWLDELRETDAPPEGEETSLPSKAFREEPLPSMGDSEDELPKWLSGIKEEAGDAEEEATGAPHMPAFTVGDGEEELPFDTGELPDWLLEEKGEEAEEIAPRQAEGAAELEPAELPDWLRAMRPMEAVTPAFIPGEEREPESQETVGPLSGLHGVVPAESEVGRFGRPPLYSMKLQATESQQRHAALLDAMLAEERVVPQAVSKPPSLRDRVLHWLVAGVLILALLVPVLTRSSNAPLPVESPPMGIQATFELIDNLAAGSPVLVAVEYQPATSGELQAAAGAVLDHLWVKGAHLALLSTQPTGPALGERLLDEVQTAGSYTNLGYLAGGSTALAGFATAPRSILSLAVGDGSGLDAPQLQSIQTADDFAMVVVLSDDPATARDWVEQVGTAMESTPLVMVLSAQAEPLIRPYFQGEVGLVKGLVGGVLGGAYYEGVSGSRGLASSYWDAFSIGLSATALVLLVGGILSAARPEQDESAKGKKGGGR